MIKTDDLINGVRGVTALARTINPKIGNYQEHFINQKIGFTVKTTGGELEVPFQSAMDYEDQPASVLPEQIESIAGTYRKSDN